MIRKTLSHWRRRIFNNFLKGFLGAWVLMSTHHARWVFWPLVVLIVLSYLINVLWGENPNE